METSPAERSGFRQKAESFNFQRFAALCRDAATADDDFGWLGGRKDLFFTNRWLAT
jgi:hypothetical protein